MKNEKMITESIFLSEDEETIYWFMESENFDVTNSAYKMSQHKLDDEHKKSVTNV